jgi:hypothetical protein
VPTISTSTGGFVGNMRTNFGFFNTVEKPELLVNSRDSEGQEQDQINYRPPSYIQIRHDRQRTRYTSNTFILTKCTQKKLNIEVAENFKDIRS